MPGCLGLDALWQLVGFYLGWLGGPGRGRALGAARSSSPARCTPDVKLVEYGIDMKRVIDASKLVARHRRRLLKADGKTIYRGDGPAGRRCSPDA